MGLYPNFFPDILAVSEVGVSDRTREEGTMSSSNNGHDHVGSRFSEPRGHFTSLRHWGNHVNQTLVNLDFSSKGHQFEAISNVWLSATRSCAD